jgi:hypothetical protein
MGTVLDSRHVLWVDQLETMSGYRAHCSCGWRSECGHGDAWACDVECGHLTCVSDPS